MREANVHVGQIDLKTLRFLSTLLESVSVTRAAERLGMSQPAASRALDRLRRAFEDPILVRTRRGYRLSARAAALSSRVADLLAAVGEVFHLEGFDPQTTTRSFRVATTDYGAVTAFADLAARFTKLAPNGQLDVMPFGPDSLEKLEHGEADLAFYADLALPPDFHYRHLFTDTYACVMKRSHALAKRKLGRGFTGALSRCSRAVLMYTEGASLVPDDVLLSLGAPRTKVSVRTPYFLAAPWILEKSDLVMCVPSRIAARMAEAARLHVVELPPEAGSFGYRAIWHERSHRDPAARWLRGLLVPEAPRALR